MSTSSTNAIIFNASGIAILATVVGYIGYAAMKDNTISPCFDRYAGGGRQLSLESVSGKPLEPIELQGRVGLREWGLLTNAKVVSSDEGPQGHVLQVNLAPVENHDQDRDSRLVDNTNGVGFVWIDPSPESTKSACLAYQVRFPEDFRFKEPGHLPGLYGATEIGEIDVSKPSKAFAIRVGWGQSGDVGLEIRSPGSSGSFLGSTSRSPWPTGRWVTVEQEVILNDAGQANGIARLWVDGSLRTQSTKLMLRPDAVTTFSGVVSDIRYARTSSVPGLLLVSPPTVKQQ